MNRTLQTGDQLVFDPLVGDVPVNDLSDRILNQDLSEADRRGRQSWSDRRSVRGSSENFEIGVVVARRVERVVVNLEDHQVDPVVGRVGGSNGENLKDVLMFRNERPLSCQITLDNSLIVSGARSDRHVHVGAEILENLETAARLVDHSFDKQDCIDKPVGSSGQGLA